jgi:hypothetical protein
MCWVSDGPSAANIPAVVGGGCAQGARFQLSCHVVDLLGKSLELVLDDALPATWSHFNWHLAHHQHPKVPWLHLPSFDDASRRRPPYFASFVRFFVKGPQPEAVAVPTESLVRPS